MKPFIRFFAERHALAYVITITIIVLGVRTLSTINRDVLPNVDLKEMNIVTLYPGGSAKDVEINVTNKLEEELKEVDGIESVTSLSIDNQSNMNVLIDRYVKDYAKVKQDIRSAVDRVVDFPPEVTQAPFVVEISTDLIPVLQISITSNELSYTKLREYALDLEEKILDLPQVSGVRQSGLRDREYKIQIDAEKAERLQISPREVYNAIRSRNVHTSAGSFESNNAEKSIVTIEELKSVEAVENVLVRSSFNGLGIYVKDVARVIDDFEDETTRARVNGNRAILFNVNKKTSADIIDTAKALTALAEKERANYKGDIQIITSGDRSLVVTNRLSVVTNNGIIGLGFVLVMLMVLLNLRVAFWTALGIPIALLGAIFFLPFFSVELSAVAMAGLIIVIGIVVDDAIVVSENITRHSEMGKSAIDAAVDGTEEVLKPVLATIITTILAFSPMFFIDGVLGDFVFVIPLVVCAALVVSFIESIFALPSHLISGFSGNVSRLGSDRKSESQVFTRYIVQPFTLIVGVLLRFRYAVIFAFILLLAGSLYYAKNHIDFILFPTDSSSQFHVIIELPPGSSLDKTEQVVKEVEDAISELPDSELQSFVSYLGLVNQNTVINSANNAFITVSLTPYDSRVRGAKDITKDLESQLKDLSGALISFQVDAGGPPVGKPITLRVTGNDNTIRDALVDDIVNKLKEMDAVSGIDSDNKKGKEQVRVIFDHNKLSQLGLDVGLVAQSLRLAFDGDIATSVRLGDDDVDFRVQLDREAINDLETIGNMLIPNNQGRLIRLREVSQFETYQAAAILAHYQNKRSTLITADVDSEVMTSVEATQSILSQIDVSRWPGMQVISDGESEETQDSIGSLGSAFVVAMLAIFLVLILLYGSIVKPLIVLSIIPFGLIGVIWTFVAHGQPISFIASIGVIGLTGVLVNDSLILVSYSETVKKLHPQLSYFEAILQAISTRFRPILITSITTVFGLIPMAYGLGGSDPLMAPMALAMGYGVTMATPLALILVPCILLVSADLKGFIKRLVGK